MKKILSLLSLVLMSCMGAWAFEAGTYTIKPYSASTQYVVPNSWAATGGEKFAYATEATMDNGGVWKFRAANNGFVIHPANTTDFVYASPNVWDASQHDEYTLGVWNTESADQTWILEPVDGQENTYTIRNQANSNAYFWYNSSSSLLYYKKTDTPDQTNWFVVEKVVTPAAFPDAGTYYLTFKGKDSGRVRYLYHDLTQADGYTLASNTEGTTNDYIWRAECDGTDMTIKNGQGQAVGMYGKYNSPAGSFQTNTLTYTPHSDCYYLIPKNATNMKSGHNCLNQPNDNAYKNAAGTFTLTSWSYTVNTNAAAAADNHWYVTEVTDKDFYDVVITDGVAASGYDYSVASYANYGDQHAANGGFFAVAKGENIDANDVTVTNVPIGKQAVVTVDDHTINITFEVPVNSINVTYTFTLNGETIGTVDRLETQGAEPTITDIIPSYVITSGMPDAVTETAYEIETSYSSLPFEIGEKCYKIDLSNGTYYIFANSRYSNAKETTGYVESRDYKWQMGGNWFTGFTFRNLSGYYIAAPNKNPGNSVSTTVPTTLNDNCYFDIVENGSFGIRFKVHGGSNYLAHTSSSDLNVQFYDYYTVKGAYNVGNRIRFTEVERISDAEVTELQGKVNALFDPMSGPIALNRIGYPKMTAATTQAVAGYSENFGTAITRSTYDAAYVALNNLYAETDINLPVPGKAYHIAVNGATGNKWYVPASDAPATDVANAATFVCGKEGSKFIFVLNDGSKYMTYNGANTDLANYDARWNSFTVSSLSAKTSGGFNESNYPAATRFGYVFIESSGRGASQPNKEGCLVVQESNGSWSAADDPFFNGAHTSALTFEEVANDVYVKLTNPNEGGTSGLDGKYVGTFSAPYHVTLPTGVKAYTAAIDGTTVNFTELGTTVPANTGVLLYAESALDAINVNAVPAGTATAAGDNAFQPTTGAEIPVGSYILANVNNHVSFYLIGDDRTVAKNKAYLTAPAGSNLSAFRFDFEGDVTGIEAIENNTNATVFDLQGRRVQNAKSGLYIVNGKKVIR